MLTAVCQARLPVLSARLLQKYTNTAAIVYGMNTMKPIWAVENLPRAETMVGIQRPRP